MPSFSLTPDELLTTTRTVRKRLDLTRPVPLELVRECLQIALQAPSGSNRQGWQWIVITDAAKRRAIGEIYGDVTRTYLAAGGSAAGLYADDPDRSATQQRVGTSAAWLGEHMGEVPVLVLASIRTDADLPPGNQAGLWGSLLPAVWNYALAARSRGWARPGQHCTCNARRRSPSCSDCPPECTRARCFRRRTTRARRSGQHHARRSTTSYISTAGERAERCRGRDPAPRRRRRIALHHRSADPRRPVR